MDRRGERGGWHKRGESSVPILRVCHVFGKFAARLCTPYAVFRKNHTGLWAVSLPNMAEFVRVYAAIHIPPLPHCF